MPKGKPWTVEEERELKQLIEAGCNAYDIAVKLGKAPNAVYEKAKRLGLKVIISSQKRKIITSNVELPEDLPSIEEHGLEPVWALVPVESLLLKKEKREGCAGDVAKNVVIKAYSHHKGLTVTQRTHAEREN